MSMEMGSAGAQRDGLHAPACRLPPLLLPTQPVRAAAKEMASQQYKKMTGTATMHEPSSRPFSGREPNAGWKTASVEGHRDFEKQVSRFQVSRVRAIEVQLLTAMTFAEWFQEAGPGRP